MLTKHTKIVCTIGPSSWSPEKLKDMIKAGMDVARLNFSHGTHEEKEKQISTIREISKELGKPIAIIADMQGPKLRLGDFDGTREIKTGDEIGLSLNPVDNELPIQFDLTPYLKKGQRIFLNDGLVELKTLEVRNKIIKAKAINSGWVSAHKGINIPDTRLTGAVFTQKDMEDTEFALKQNVDYLALSFIQHVDDLKEAIKLIKKHNSRTRIVVKVEKSEAVVNIEEIIKSSDAIMVARGDLAIETAASQVPLIQQKIVNFCRQYQKPVIIATQMLESMIENPRPTRAETSDVANAVLAQVDAVMLSAESAAGKYPVESVQTMTEIIRSVEAALEAKKYIRIDWEHIPKEDYGFSAIAASAASLAFRTNSRLIAVGTTTGRLARLMASFRPDASILAVTHDEQTKQQLALVWGVDTMVVKPLKDHENFWKHIIEIIKEKDLADKGDTIVMVFGSQKIGVTGGTDTIRTAVI